MAVKQTNGEADATKLGEKLSARMQKIVNGEAPRARLHSPRRGARGARRRVRRRHAVAGGRRPGRAVSLALSVKYVKEAIPGPTKKRWLKRWMRESRRRTPGAWIVLLVDAFGSLWTRGGASERLTETAARRRAD